MHQARPVQGKQRKRYGKLVIRKLQMSQDFLHSGRYLCDDGTVAHKGEAPQNQELRKLLLMSDKRVKPKSRQLCEQSQELQPLTSGDEDLGEGGPTDYQKQNKKYTEGVKPRVLDKILPNNKVSGTHHGLVSYQYVQLQDLS